MPTLMPLTSPRDQASFQRCLRFAKADLKQNAAFKKAWEEVLPNQYCPKTNWPEFDPWPGEGGEEFTINVPSDPPGKYKLNVAISEFHVGQWLFVAGLDEFDLQGALQRQGKTVGDWNGLAEEGSGRDFIQTILECLRRGYLTLRDLELYGGPLLPDGFESSGGIRLRVEFYDIELLKVCERREQLVGYQVMELFKSYQYEYVRVCDRFRVAARYADENKFNGGYRIEYFEGETVKSLDIADAELRAQGSGLWKRLANEGFVVEATRQAQDAFRKLLTEWPGLQTRPSIIKFSRSGFHCGNLIYISPNGDAVIDQVYEGSRLFDLATEAKIPGGTGRVVAMTCALMAIVAPQKALEGEEEALGYPIAKTIKARQRVSWGPLRISQPSRRRCWVRSSPSWTSGR